MRESSSKKTYWKYFLQINMWVRTAVHQAKQHLIDVRELGEEVASWKPKTIDGAHFRACISGILQQGICTALINQRNQNTPEGVEQITHFRLWTVLFLVQHQPNILQTNLLDEEECKRVRIDLMKNAVIKTLEEMAAENPRVRSCQQKAETRLLEKYQLS